MLNSATKKNDYRSPHKFTSPAHFISPKNKNLVKSPMFEAK